MVKERKKYLFQGFESTGRFCDVCGRWIKFGKAGVANWNSHIDGQDHKDANKAAKSAGSKAKDNIPPPEWSCDNDCRENAGQNRKKRRTSRGPYRTFSTQISTVNTSWAKQRAILRAKDEVDVGEPEVLDASKFGWKIGIGHVLSISSTNSKHFSGPDKPARHDGGLEVAWVPTISCPISSFVILDIDDSRSIGHQNN
ncbi:hypothetical protein DFH07DRAFT_775061 [Mycena maculata]|uniref:Uncharacterized protein n=1 Tax=Mycena maculata TaxID=230809 RepID=A0AAD7N9V1_9AGAR|nr:hypothetical protein DFH07DRAFT_775061 [Mycena maculata]